MATSGYPQWRARRGLSHLPPKDSESGSGPLWQRGSSQPGREGWGPVEVSPLSPLYFRKSREGGVGPGREEARVWTFHAIQTQRTRAAEESWAGRGAGSCFSGLDRLKWCSVLTREKWKMSIKLAVLGERNQSFPSGAGEYWGTQGQWGQGGDAYTALLGPGSPATGGGVSISLV